MCSDDSDELKDLMVKEFTLSGKEAERVRNAEALLASIGITLPPTGRFSKYAQIIRKWADAAAAGQREGVFGAELGVALEEMKDICLVIEEFVSLAEDPSIHQRLREVVRKGAFLSNEERAQTRARDFQWEMTLAAVFMRLGLATELIDPPDLVVHCNGHKLAVAAKRPKSQNVHGVLACVQRGANQLVKFGLPGFLAVDLSVVAGLDNRPIVMDSHAEADRYLEYLGLLGTKQIMDPLNTSYRPPNLLGVMVRVRHTYVDKGTKEICTQSIWPCITFDSDEYGANLMSALGDHLYSHMSSLVA